jgi:hypothetical protein
MSTIYSYKQNTAELDSRLMSGGFSPDSVVLVGNATVTFSSPLSPSDKSELDQSMLDAGFSFDSQTTGSGGDVVLLTGNATDPGTSPAGNAWLWYDSTLNQLRVSLSGGAATNILTGAAGTVSLQSAYDSGSTINLAAATPVTLDKATADATAALQINLSDGTGPGLSVNLSGSASGPSAVFVGGSVGIGVSSPNSTLHVDGSFSTSFRSVSANAVAMADDAVIAVDASGGDVTITLPTAIGVKGRTYYVKKIDSSMNVVFVQATGGQTIDGLTTQNLSIQWESMQIVSDGATGWLKI